jgi:hypothetical protein
LIKFVRLPSLWAHGASSFISVFAGRIADTGRDPMPLMSAAAEIVSAYPNIELIWASPRELLNIFQANDAGCHIITVPDNILSKLDSVGKEPGRFLTRNRSDVPCRCCSLRFQAVGISDRLLRTLRDHDEAQRFLPFENKRSIKARAGRDHEDCGSNEGKGPQTALGWLGASCPSFPNCCAALPIRAM